MAVLESGQMYLETILILSKKNDEIHAVDVAEYMQFSKPSVSRAMRLLREDGMITIDKAGHIFMTDKGRMIAEKIYERHIWLTHFLVELGVPDQVAQDDACKIEHCISDETFDAIKCHFEKFGQK